MGKRNYWSDYAELMTLLPAGNRQIATAIAKRVGKITRGIAARLTRAWRRPPDGPYLP